VFCLSLDGKPKIWGCAITAFSLWRGRIRNQKVYSYVMLLLQSFAVPCNLLGSTLILQLYSTTRLKTEPGLVKNFEKALESIDSTNLQRATIERVTDTPCMQSSAQE